MDLPCLISTAESESFRKLIKKNVDRWSKVDDRKDSAYRVSALTLSSHVSMDR